MEQCVLLILVVVRFRNHMTARDSNRGGCCQSCRWDYDLYELNQDGEQALI